MSLFISICFRAPVTYTTYTMENNNSLAKTKAKAQNTTFMEADKHI